MLYISRKPDFNLHVLPKYCENKLNMKTSELRIGNIINYEATTHIVKGIKEDIVYSYWHKDDRRLDLFGSHISEHKPIKITEEWLLKLGFNKCNYKTVYHAPNSTIFLLNGRAVKHYKRQDVEYFRMVREDVNIKYIHELQNLVFALTGVELTAEPAR